MKKSDRQVLRVYTDEKTGANVQVLKAEATTKDKATGKRIVVWSGEYHEPVTLNDGIKLDGRDEVTKVWKSERYTNALDAERNALKESRSALTKLLIAAITAGDAVKIVELSVKLGIDLTKGLKSAASQLVAAEQEEDETDESDDSDDADEVRIAVDPTIKVKE